MSTNKHLQWYNQQNEQYLYDDLYVEYVKNHGHDVFYLPRTGVNKNEMLNEYSISKFTQALPIECYVKNFDSFEGDGQLLSKFGLEVRDQMTLVISIRSFEQYVKPYINSERPFEGDCFFIPMLGLMYQIKYVNSSAIFYTLGKLNTYEIQCDLLEFSNEIFQTGIADIDNKYRSLGNAADIDYQVEHRDLDADNADIEGHAENVLDFGESSPFVGVGDH